jgi:hypothetical protein
MFALLGVSGVFKFRGDNFEHVLKDPFEVITRAYDPSIHLLCGV